MTPKLLHLKDGLYTRYVDSGGDKKVVVLTHALSNSLEIWERVYPNLIEDFRVIAFDFQGYGHASRPDASYDGAFFGAQIGAVMDALKIETANLAGYSVGASAILYFSKANLHRIDRAVVVAPGGVGHQVHPLMLSIALPLVGPWLARPTNLANLTTLQLSIFDKRNITPELIARTNAYALVAGSPTSLYRSIVAGVGLLGARNVDKLLELARGFTRPALVLWGKQDKVFPARYASRIGDVLPDAQVSVIDQCGHYLPWEQPDVFSKAVREFLL